jgi:MFS superfamily sulfate permease-like transporter
MRGNAPAPSTWQGLIGGAAMGTLASLPVVLTQGLLAYAALGVAGPALGIPAAFGSIAVGGLVFALLGRGAMAAGGPVTAQVLMLAGLVAKVANDPAFEPGQPDFLGGLLALAAASVVGMGLLQVAIAMVGLVRLAKFVPQPVLAGFMNGVALLIVLSQLPVLLGWPAGAWSTEGWLAFSATQPATLAVGVFTIACIVLAQRARSRIPAQFMGLLLGVAAYFALAHFFPAVALGPLVGELPRALPRSDATWPWVAGDSTGLLHRHAGEAMMTALLLALVGTLDTVLNCLALDQALKTRTDPKRALIALGTANVAAGLLGSLPVAVLRQRALETVKAGGRAPWSLVLGCLLFALLAAFGGPLLALLPKVVLAGIMVMIAYALADRWTGQLLARWWDGVRTPDMQLNLGVVAVVCAITIVLGFAVGVGVGALLSIALFIHSMNRSMLRARYTAAMRPSRRIYPAVHEAKLHSLRERITVLELEGALFFGSADRVAVEVDALAADSRVVVLDFKRVTLTDASGAVVLSQVGQRMQARGVTLLLAGVATHNRHGHALGEFAGAALPTRCWYSDADLAVEAAELLLLAEANNSSQFDASQDAVPLGSSTLMAGLDEAQRECLARLLEARRLAPGERLFREGDAGDHLYLLTEGSISVLSADSSGQPGQRYVSFSPGMILGETAMLDGGGRTADAIADSPAVVYALSSASLQDLQVQDPALWGQLHLNIARHLSQRLRAAAAAWRAGTA